MCHDDALLAGEVRAVLARRNMTQREIGKILSTNASTAGRKWRGDSPYKAIELAAISRATGVPIESFLAGAERPSEEVSAA